MIKNLFFLLIFTSSSCVIFSQQLELVQSPDNDVDYASLKNRMDIGGSVGKILISDIQDPLQNGNNYQDLHYNIFSKLYFEKTNATIQTLKERVVLPCTLTVKGTDHLNAPNVTTTRYFDLIVSPNSDYATSIFHFNENEVLDLQLHSLTEVELSFSSSSVDYLDDEILDLLILELYVEYVRYEETELILKTRYDKSSVDLKENEIMLWWEESPTSPGSIPDNTTYEVEWVHMPKGYKKLISGNTYWYVDFSNARRIQTKNEYYPITKVHDDGYILARVRAVRHQLSNDKKSLTEKKLYTKWSIPDLEFLTDAYPGEHVNYLTGVIELDSPVFTSDGQFNYEYTSTYAQNGKRVETVKIYDGSNRPRQNLSFFPNDENRSFSGSMPTSQIDGVTYIGSESYYDYNGVEQITILPSPLLSSSGMEYQSNLNEYAGNKISVANFDHKSLSVFPQALDESAPGATNYYSPSNDLYDVPTGTNPDRFSAFIPDANGYPYMRKEFLADGSGRLKREFGMGDVLALDVTNEKNTRYFYAKPTQSELEFLFGTNVGEARFYKKNVTIDGNGVASIAYIDQKDRTVATSISGSANASSNMVDIPFVPKTFTEDLMANGNLEFIEKDHLYKVQYPIFVPENGNYIFDYELNKNNFLACSNLSGVLCYSCPYEFTFQIIDQEGNLIIDTDIAFIPGGSTPGICDPTTFELASFNVKHADYSAADILNGVLTVPLKAENQYTIVQKLQLMTDGVEAKAENYLNSAVCDRYDEEHFISIELEKADFSTCKTNFEDECSFVRDKMIEDFTYPYGAFVENASLDEYIVDHILVRTRRVVNNGVFGYLLSDPPTAKEIAEIDYRNSVRQDFLDAFGLSDQPTFAEFKQEYISFFLDFHPSYCKLNACELLYTEESKNFDRILEESETPNDFISKALANIPYVSNNFSNAEVKLRFEDPANPATTSNTLHVHDNTVWVDRGGLEDWFEYLNKYDNLMNYLPSEGGFEFHQDILLLAFDKTLLDFSLTHPSKTIGNFEPRFFETSKRCYFNDINGIVWGEGSFRSEMDNLYLMLGYFADYLGCSNYANYGIAELAFNTSDKNASNTLRTKQFWKVYKGLYANAKQNFIYDVINNSSCDVEKAPIFGGNSENGNKVFYYTDPSAGTFSIPATNGWYWGPEYEWGEWWTNGSDLDIYLGEEPSSHQYSNISDPSQFKDDNVDEDNILQKRLIQDVIDQVNLEGSGCEQNFNSSSFEDSFEDPGSPLKDFLNDPRTYLNNFFLLSTCTAYDINLSAVLAPYYHYFQNPDGTPFSTKSHNPLDKINCKKLIDDINTFDATLGLTKPLLPNGRIDIDINNTQQKRLTYWLNLENAVNFSFLDYYELAESCVASGSGNNMFNTPNDWSDLTSQKQKDIRRAIYEYGNVSNQFWTDLSSSTMCTQLNSELVGFSSSYSVNCSTDYLGMGEIDYGDNQHYLYYLENAKSTYDALLVEMNAVFAEIQSELDGFDDFEDSYVASAMSLPTSKGQSVTNTSLKIDRALRYSNGTIWVRLLDNLDNYYDDFYFHYIPYYSGDDDELGYKLSELTDPSFSGFTDIDPIFDAESMHYFWMSDGSHKLLASTSNEIMKAVKISKVELNNVAGKGLYPLTEGCEDLKHQEAVLNGKVEYQEYLNGLKDDFKKNYISFCTNINSSAFTQELSLNYTSKERNYTLYFYDQADNLTMTVPPKGVKSTFKKISSTGTVLASDLGFNLSLKQMIRDYRSGVAQNMIVPEHTHKTIYQYNSENQIIKQETPNGGITLFWYDKAGRLVLSQNSKQRVAQMFSYTLYDNQSRIEESGEVLFPFLMNQDGVTIDENWNAIQSTVISGKFVTDPELNFNLKNIIQSKLRESVTKTYYDNSLAQSYPSDFSQDNVRSRVVTQAYFNALSGNTIKVGDNIQPFLFLPMNGDALDMSINHFNGVKNNTSDGPNRDQEENSAYNFNGTDSKITIPHQNKLNIDELTVSTWIKGLAADNNGGSRIVGKHNGGNNQNERGWIMMASTAIPQKDRLQVVISEDGTNNSSKIKRYVSSTAVFDNSWHHVAFTFGNGELKLFIDGVEDVNPIKSKDASINSINNNNIEVSIGYGLVNGIEGYFLEGFIDNVVIYDEVLSDVQINELYQDNISIDNFDWAFATHYSYDPVGNVKTVLNDYFQEGKLTEENHRFKRLDYAYDPVSGNVLRAYYQLGKEDAFYHKYTYDAQNRINEVETSRNGIIWDKDATYDYYKHGPLARMEIGENKVQGLDYAYTLQGWLKSVNSGLHSNDIGGDHIKDPVNGSGALFGEDAFGYSLQYFDGDYDAISGNSNFLLDHPTADLSNLYNGNISAQSLHNKENTILKAYYYDQLNRISSFQEHTLNSNSWSVANVDGIYANYSYDENGNIDTLKRYNGAHFDQLLDDMVYNYSSSTDQLLDVIDNALEDGNYPGEFVSQSSENYSYDQIGNLIKDEQAEIESIQWYPNGKIKRVSRISPSALKPNLVFSYDALGNRVKKEVSFTEDNKYHIKSTYYIRDAQGNLMATYDERDCSYESENSNEETYYFQFSHDFAYYIKNTALTLPNKETELIDYLTSNNFGGQLQMEALCDQAFQNLSNITNIRNLIFPNVNVLDYINQYPASASRLINSDASFYADYLFDNDFSDFKDLVNDRNEVWIEALKFNGSAQSFYNQVNTLYLSSGLSVVGDYFDMNTAVLGGIINSNSTLFKSFLRINNLQYNQVYDSYNDPNYGYNLLHGSLIQLENELINQNTTYIETIRTINGILMVVDLNQIQLSGLLNSINLQTFYNALTTLNSQTSDELNSVLYHINSLYISNSMLSPIQTNMLNHYKPMVAMDWSQDLNGTYLDYYLHTSIVNPSLLPISAAYFSSNSVGMTDRDIYFNITDVKNYVKDALSRNANNTTVEDAIVEYDNLNYSKELLYINENLSNLTNYLKVNHPKKVLLINFYDDYLLAALGGLNNYTPNDLINDLTSYFPSVTFETPEDCAGNTDEAHIEVESFDLYGSSRLGVMNAKVNQKDDDNLYSRKFGAKQYELSDHLGNVVATMTDKKLHPQELVTNGNQTIDNTIGFQAEVTNRYDRYPFGMEIVERSGDFTTIDNSQSTYRVVYEGLLNGCDDFVKSPQGVETCTISQNIYLQDYVSFYENAESATDPFTITLKLRLSQVIPNLDPEEIYRIEIYLESTEFRYVTSTIDGTTNGLVTSESAPSGASGLQIGEASDKLVSYELKGSKIQSLASSNGILDVDISLAGIVPQGPPPNFVTSTAIEVDNIRISQVFQNSSVSTAKRSASAYRYGFQGQEVDNEWDGVAFGGGEDPLFERDFNPVFIYQEWFSSDAAWIIGESGGTPCATISGDEMTLQSSTDDCGAITTNIYVESGKRYHLFADVDLTTASDLKIYLEYYNNSTSSWTLLETIDVSSGRAEYNIIEEAPSDQLRVKFSSTDASTNSLTAKVYNVSIRESMPGWNVGIGSHGKVNAYDDNDGRLRLQNISSWGGAIYNDIAVRKKGSVHTITFDAERVNLPNTLPNAPYYSYVIVKERNAGGSWTNVPGGIYSPNNITSKTEISRDFTPTKDFIQVYITSSGNNYPEAMEFYVDNIKITDGTTHPDDAGGISNKVAFKYRIHDARIGRFLSVDPLSANFPWNSPYSFAMNRVIDKIELEGAEIAQPGYITENSGYVTALDNTGRGAITENQYKQMAASMNYKPPVVMPSRGSVGPDGMQGDPAFQQFQWQANNGVIKYVLPVDITKKIMRGEEIAAWEVGLELVSVVPVAKIFGKVGKALAKSEFGEAAINELATFFKNNVDESASIIKSRLQKSVKSHNKQIAKHKEWIADPKKKYGDKWDKMSDEHKSNAVNHWKQDVKRHEASKAAKSEALSEIE